MYTSITNYYRHLVGQLKTISSWKQNSQRSHVVQRWLVMLGYINLTISVFKLLYQARWMDGCFTRWGRGFDFKTRYVHIWSLHSLAIGFTRIGWHSGRIIWWLRWISKMLIRRYHSGSRTMMWQWVYTSQVSTCLDAGGWCFISSQYLRSHQDGYQVVTVRTHGDFIVLPHWATRPGQILYAVNNWNS